MATAAWKVPLEIIDGRSVRHMLYVSTKLWTAATYHTPTGDLTGFIVLHVPRGVFSRAGLRS